MFAAIILLFIFFSTFSYSWHAYDKVKVPSNSCLHYYVDHNKTISQKLVKSFKLWPITNLHEGFGGSVLFGSEMALQKIWENQHPADCSKAKFLISNNWIGGFGSEVHVHSAALGLAMTMGRVLLQNPYTLENMKWKVENDFCREQVSRKNNLDCYFEPWSSCTIEDAIGPNGDQIMHDIVYSRRKTDSIMKSLILSKEEHKEMLTGAEAVHRITAKYAEERNLYTKDFGNYEHGYIPESLQELAACSPMNAQHSYYWWRAISTSYLLRPNAYTIDFIRKHETDHFQPFVSALQQPSRSMLGIYVRRGDKATEMELVGLDTYLETAEVLWDTRLTSNASVGEKSKRHLFFASEDSKVLREVTEYAAAKGVALFYTDLFERKGLYAELNVEQRQRVGRGAQRHHPLEYMSMLLNIHYLLECDAWVCTLASNFCRVIDELRAVVAWKASAPYADVSKETCGNAKFCLDEGIKHFDW